MPKKKRKPRHPKPPQSSESTRRAAAKRRTEAQSGFSRWLRGQVSPASAAQIEDDLRLLLELKADHLDSPDPRKWTAETTEVLLTDVLPRQVVRDRSDAMLIVSSLGTYFEYLEATGQWSRGSIAVGDAHDLLSELEFDVVEAMDDPTRRGFGGNIMSYAVEQGIEFSGEEDVNRYMAWYNSLPHPERIELSDTGRLAAPSRPFDPSVPADAYPAGDLDAAPQEPSGVPRRDRGPSRSGGDLGDLDDELEEEFRRDWPWFLGDPPDWDEEEDTQPFDRAQMRAEHESSTLVHRARTLLDLVGDSRKVTQTGALTRADTREVLSRFGIESEVRSMWGVPEVAGPWQTLLDGRWIETSGARARRGDGLVPVASAAFDPEGFSRFAHALLSQTLLSLALRGPREGGFTGMPDTAQALLRTVRPEGLTLPVANTSNVMVDEGPQLPTRPGSEEPDYGELVRLLRVEVDLTTLAAYGAIEGDGRNFRAPTALVQAIDVMADVLRETEER